MIYLCDIERKKRVNKRLYKDSPISVTTNNIKKILQDNNIYVKEELLEGFKGVFSVNLSIDELGMCVNGKGTTAEIAIASAYGELIERIQNFALYKFTYPAVLESRSTGFMYAADEVSIPLVQQKNDILGPAISAKTQKINKLLSDYEQSSGKVLCLPYTNYYENETVYLSARFVEHIYASNGMAAGNTSYEALVQSICEIFERFSNMCICVGDMVPPDIPIESIKFSKEISEVIFELRKNNDYDIYFKDCSLGLGLPVVGMFLVNRNSGKYFVKFGAHPILEVAAERTITELYQGRKHILSNFWMRNFTFDEIQDTQKNFKKIFRSGDGAYTYKLFSGDRTYDLSESWINTDEIENIDNMFLFEYLMKIIQKNEWDFLYRDVSFLGFPTVHSIIPQISYVTIIDDEYISRNIEFKKVLSSLSALRSCSKSELLQIIEFIDNNGYSSYDSLSPLIEIPSVYNDVLANTNNLYFKFLIYATINENEKALENLDEYIATNNLQNAQQATFFRCLREAFSAIKIKGLSIKTTIDIMNNVFSEGLVEETVNIIKSNSYFAEFNECKLDSCISCSCFNECKYQKIMEFHKKISKKYSEWMVVNG